MPAPTSSPIVVVTGLPRSGTSMVMRMLTAGGLEGVTDGERTADEDNPRGYFEDERVKGLAAAEDKAWIADARGKVLKVISYLLKDLPDEHTYKVIFLHRRFAEVLASQAKMLDRRGEKSDVSDARMKKLFERHVVAAYAALTRRPNVEILDLQYGDVVGDPTRAARRIAEHLGRELDEMAMAAAVDPTLYRNRSD